MCQARFLSPVSVTAGISPGLATTVFPGCWEVRQKDGRHEDQDLIAGIAPASRIFLSPIFLSFLHLRNAWSVQKP